MKAYGRRRESTCLGGQVKSGQSWTPQNRPAERPGQGHLPRGFFLRQGLTDFGAPAAGAALEDVAMVQQAIQHGGHSSGITEDLSPVIDGPV